MSLFHVHVVLNFLNSIFSTIDGSNQGTSQLQFVLNTIFGIFNILVAAFIPILLFAVQNKRGLAYEVSDGIVYLVDSASQTMIQGYQVVIRLWNSGRQSIIPEDIYGPIEFVFGTGADIRDVKIIRRNPPTLGVTEPTIEGSGTKISIAKPSTPFNKPYWVEIKLVMLMFHDVLEVNSSIRDCELKEIPQYLMKSRKLAFIGTYVVFTIFILLTLFISFIDNNVLNQPVDLIVVGAIWIAWIARKLDFSPRKLRAMIRVCPLVLVLLASYIVLHFVTIYLLVPNLLNLLSK